ncbi:signal transduction histidine kinase [Thermocatellispora tengchongensis]|uniref:histidine kinase n=2 Tax=Thermocatellispora tengchongensis TaxID=1073253 RepID=A0A840PPI0_9ACTN|nr:histidine kinase [Thermocatellispora tengchongensis]MBB5139681.1 signal transduction histidine kinase [Thermocatellispora tengchongensis]
MRAYPPDAIALAMPVATGLAAAALAFLAGLAGIIGWCAQERRRLLRRLRAERDRLAAQERELEWAAAAEERFRIAGEMHDVVAHGVSVMTLGVGAGRMIMDKDPERARQTLREAEESGRQTLTDLQRMVGLLRGHADPARGGTEPQPRLSDLPRLVAACADGGLHAELTEDGRRPAGLSPLLELAVCRIVQDALGDAVRHRAATEARVSLRWRHDAVTVIVRDTPAPGRDPAARGPLTAARERAGVFGGTVTAGPLPSGGHELRAGLWLAGVGQSASSSPMENAASRSCLE